MPKLMLVEDVAPLAETLARGLGEEGFTVLLVTTGAAALERLVVRDLDVVVLDLGLPDIDGIEVLRLVRAAGAVAPILVLTARDAVASRVAALEAGADDYMIKPIAFVELLARLRALMRRAGWPRWAPLACEDVVLEDPGCSVSGRPIALSPRERTLLELFMRRRGETLARAEILREAFGYDFDPGTNIVDVHVGHLRKKLDGARVAFEAVRGAGYRLVAR